jgi:unsaturated chondroitin disaccharide hydrolase
MRLAGAADGREKVSAPGSATPARRTRAVGECRRAVVALAMVAAVLCVAAPAVPATDDGMVAIRDARRAAVVRLRSTELATRPGRFTYATDGARWTLKRARSWTSGYAAGELWLAYQLTGERWWRERAASREAPIGALDVSPALTDLGVLFYPSYARGFVLTGDGALRDVALRAAAALAARYDPRVGAVRSRRAPDGFFVNVDSLLDLRLLWWGAANGGPRVWREIARTHALTVARDLVRADGSTCHVVLYDEASGAVLERRRGQGFSADSMWARGQAWAIAGFAGAYRQTREPALLAAARRVADRYLLDLPEDRVPYWDFRAPGIPGEPRDSSAAAIAASGLIDLALVEPNAVRADHYAAAARATLSALASAAYASTGPTPSLLAHGALDVWSGDVDSGLAYGDYFYLEAMLRLRRLPPATRSLEVTRVRASAGDAGRAVDGDLGTGWRTVGRQRLDVDLGRTRAVSAVRIAVRTGSGGAARLRILTSTSDGAWRLAVRTLTSGETQAFETYEFAPREARWVRLEWIGSARGSADLIREMVVCGVDGELASPVASGPPRERSAA